MSLDYHLFRVLNDLANHGHIVRAIVRFYASNGALIFPLALVLLWVCPGPQSHAVRTAVVLAGVATLLALGANQILNHAINRPRPYTSHEVHLLLPRSGDASFPSDHTAVAFAVTASLWALRRRISVLLGLLGLFLGMSRVIAGVHYPGDIAGGALVGISSGLIVGVARTPIGAVAALGERVYNKVIASILRLAPGRSKMI